MAAAPRLDLSDSKYYRAIPIHTDKQRTTTILQMRILHQKGGRPCRLHMFAWHVAGRARIQYPSYAASRANRNAYEAPLWVPESQEALREPSASSPAALGGLATRGAEGACRSGGRAERRAALE